MIRFKKFIKEITVSILAFLGIAFFWQNNTILSVWMLILIALLLLWEWSTKDFLVVLVGFVLGWFVEILAVRIGFEQYMNPSFLGYLFGYRFYGGFCFFWDEGFLRTKTIVKIY